MIYPVIFVCLIITLAAVFLFCINAYVIFEYAAGGQEDHTTLSISIFRGMIKYKRELNEKGFKRPGEDNGHEEKEGRNGILAECYDKYIHFRTVYNVLDNIKKYLQKTLFLREFNLEISLGAGDAFYTGILSGIAWTASGMLFSYLMNSFKKTDGKLKKRINIKADYLEKMLKIDLYCIFITKIVYIIVVALKIAFSTFKQRMEKRKTGGG